MIHIKKPWGWERVVGTWENWKTKILHVNMGARTSLQYHREKFEIMFNRDGSYRTIPPNTVHRLEGPVEVLEISMGTDVDIVRLEDDYHRNKGVVAVSGGFDPLHFGHIRYFQAAQKLGTKLQVWLCSDEWLIRKKGYVFMFYEERKEILEALSCVDEVLPQINEKDDTTFESLIKYKPDIFAKGGDRTLDNLPLSEIEVCKELGIELRTGVGGSKIQSSSDLVRKVIT